MFTTRTNSKFAFNDPLKMNNMLFQSSGNRYSGNYWLGSGQDLGAISLNEDLTRSAGGVLELTKLAVRGLFRKLISNRYFSLLVLFFSYNPE